MNPEDLFDEAALDVARAIAAGDPARVRALAPHVDLNAPGAMDFSLLLYAIRCASSLEPARLAVITELARAGADAVDVRHPELGSALELSLGATSPAFLRALLDAGVDPDARVRDGALPAIFEALNARGVEGLKLLVERGADVNARDSLGGTVLVDALCGFYLDEAAYLLDHHADPRAVNRLGVSFPYTLAHLLAGEQAHPPTAEKLASLRDRVVAMGVAWPPAPPAVERDRMRARGEEPITPAGLDR